MLKRVTKLERSIQCNSRIACGVTAYSADPDTYIPYTRLFGRFDCPGEPSSVFWGVLSPAYPVRHCKGRAPTEAWRRMSLYCEGLCIFPLSVPVYHSRIPINALLFDFVFSMNHLFKKQEFFFGDHLSAEHHVSLCLPPGHKNLHASQDPPKQIKHNSPGFSWGPGLAFP